MHLYPPLMEWPLPVLQERVRIVVGLVVTIVIMCMNMFGTDTANLTSLLDPLNVLDILRACMCVCVCLFFYEPCI